jgi:hypothetical protein
LLINRIVAFAEAVTDALSIKEVCLARQLRTTNGRISKEYTNLGRQTFEMQIFMEETGLASKYREV